MEVVGTGLVVVGHIDPGFIGRWSGVPEDQDVGRLAVVNRPARVVATLAEGDHADPGHVGDVLRPLARHQGRAGTVRDIPKSIPAVPVEDAVIRGGKCFGLPLSGDSDVLGGRRLLTRRLPELSLTLSGPVAPVLLGQSKAVKLTVRPVSDPGSLVGRLKFRELKSGACSKLLRSMAPQPQPGPISCPLAWLPCVFEI